MKLGIIGLPQTGKKSLFELLTGNQVTADMQAGAKIVAGQATIRDERFDRISSLYHPKKETPAKIDLQLFPKIDSGTIRDGKIFQDIADMDALCHIVRAFRDDSIYHVSGSVDARRDIDAINSELIMHDLIFIEKREERIRKDSQNKKKDDRTYEHEKKILALFRGHLEEDRFLRTCPISPEDEKIISGYPFITRKKMLVVLNVDEGDIRDSKELAALSAAYAPRGIDVMQVSAKLESEVALLDTEEERREFMKDMGIAEPAMAVLSRLAMKTLGLISFFTAGEKEVRQWLIRSGSSAPEAGGAVHSDIQRGFIRAEVFKFNDLMELGSEEAVKKAGKFHLMGKEYYIEDGDIVYFRFNV